MQRVTIWLLVLSSIFTAGCSDQLGALGGTFMRSLLFVLPFIAVVIGIIFAMNKWIVDSRGRTNDRLCSIIGVITFPIIFTVAFALYWSWDWWVILIAVGLGAPIGWFSYTLDELMESFWENRVVTIPGLIGLVLGGAIIVSFFTGTWIEGDMYVTNKACSARAVVERYRESCSTDSDGNRSCSDSWNYVSHIDRIADGWQLPQLQENIDYRLGRGDYGRKDRVRFESYFLIGGVFYSEDQNDWSEFRWLVLKNKIQVEIKQVQKIRSNFYGQPVENAGEVKAPKPVPKSVAAKALTDEYLPPARTTVKALSIVWDTFAQLFTEEEFRPLLYMFLALFGLLGGLAAFVPVTRSSVFAFTICFFVVALIAVMVIAARTGSLGSGRGGRRRSGGGGGFGGRSFTR